MEALEDLMASMSEEGFSKTDYNVMENSCNTFTEAFYPYNLRPEQLTFFPGPGSETGSDGIFPQRCSQTNQTWGHPLSPGEEQSEPCIVSHSQ